MSPTSDLHFFVDMCAFNVGLRGRTTAATVDPNSHSAALAACTLSGAFKSVPMTGGGLEVLEPPKWAFDHHCSRPPATGVLLLHGPIDDL